MEKNKVVYAENLEFLKTLERIIKIHSNIGDVVLDFFAGSGTTGAVAGSLGRKFILVDNNKDAIEVTKKRLSHLNIEVEEYVSSLSASY